MTYDEIEELKIVYGRNRLFNPGRSRGTTNMRVILTYEYTRYLKGTPLTTQVYWCATCDVWHEHRMAGPDLIHMEKCDATVRLMKNNQRMLRPARNITCVCIGPLPDMCRNRERHLMTNVPPPVDVNAITE